MILVDMHFYLHRYVAVVEKEEFAELKKDHKNGNERQPTRNELENFQKTFLHFIINDLLWLKKQHKNKYGDLVLTFDSSPSWRKEYYNKYKSNRETKKRNSYEQIIRKMIPFMKKAILNILSDTNIRVMNVEKCEGDDIIAVLANSFRTDHIIIAADQDFKQILSPNIKMYNPVTRKTIPKPTKRELEIWKITNIIAGQRKDGIPPIVHNCKMSKEFIKYMNDEHGIDISVIDMTDIETNYKHFMQEYENKMNQIEEQLIQEGKKKKRKTWSAYDNKPFGEVAAMKFNKELETMLENPCYKKNYERNKKLLMLDMIPEEIEKSIMKEYDNQSNKFYDEVALINTLQKYKLYELAEKIDWF